jgi:resuscitation-promoting factor RpfB
VTRAGRPSSAHVADVARPSPARAEPHDETSWLPLPELEDLPPIEDLRTETDEAADIRDIPVGLPSPARAEPHDETSWLPLPEIEDLPPIEDLVTPDAPELLPPARDLTPGPPSPARAEPHDETSWLPLPEVEDLPEITELVDPDTATAAVPPVGGTARRARFAVPPRRALAAALVAASLIVGVYAVPKLLGSGGDHVQLQVDGRQVNARSSASTVGAFLLSEHIKLGPADRVVPTASTALSDGLTVRIVRAFPVNVTIDGSAQVMYTADSQPKDFVASLKLASTVAMLNGPTKLRAGAHLELNTRRVGTLAVDGQAVNFNLPVLTVQELLANYQVKLGPQDFTTPSVNSIIPVDNAFVTVTRVAIATTSQIVPYSLPLVTVNDPNTPIGQTHDSPGTPGWLKITYEITNNNGSAVGQVPISQVPVVAAVAPVHYIGSKADPRWEEIAQCETGGNWSMVGSTYSGGLGIYNGTWNAFGGQQFASNPGYATREQQIIVAERIRARYGFGAWGCGRKLGLG